MTDFHPLINHIKGGLELTFEEFWKVGEEFVAPAGNQWGAFQFITRYTNKTKGTIVMPQNGMQELYESFNPWHEHTPRYQEGGKGIDIVQRVLEQHRAPQQYSQDKVVAFERKQYGQFETMCAEATQMLLISEYMNRPTGAKLDSYLRRGMQIAMIGGSMTNPIIPFFVQRAVEIVQGIKVLPVSGREFQENFKLHAYTQLKEKSQEAIDVLTGDMQLLADL